MATPLVKDEVELQSAPPEPVQLFQSDDTTSSPTNHFDENNGRKAAGRCLDQSRDGRYEHSPVGSDIWPFPNQITSPVVSRRSRRNARARARAKTKAPPSSARRQNRRERRARLSGRQQRPTRQKHGQRSSAPFICNKARQQPPAFPNLMVQDEPVSASGDMAQPVVSSEPQVAPDRPAFSDRAAFRTAHSRMALESRADGALRPIWYDGIDPVPHIEPPRSLEPDTGKNAVDDHDLQRLASLRHMQADATTGESETKFHTPSRHPEALSRALIDNVVQLASPKTHQKLVLAHQRLHERAEKFLPFPMYRTFGMEEEPYGVHWMRPLARRIVVDQYGNEFYEVYRVVPPSRRRYDINPGCDARSRAISVLREPYYHDDRR